jgi:hypothetical protein
VLRGDSRLGQSSPPCSQDRVVAQAALSELDKVPFDLRKPGLQDLLKLHAIIFRNHIEDRIVGHWRAPRCSVSRLDHTRARPLLMMT